MSQIDHDSITNDPSLPENSNLKGDDALLFEAKERYKLCVEYATDIHDQAVKDMNYLAGNQWDNEVKNQRELDSRPTLTINRLNPFVNQVKNDLIQNSPSIKVRPVDTKDTKTANVINGLIRHIINNVDGKSALDTALSYAIRCGIGYVRVKTEYVDDGSFDNQEICLERIEDPLLVHFPLPLCKMQDYSDAPYCIVRTLISKRDYKELYPDKWDKYCEWETAAGEAYNGWAEKESLWIAEYFKVEKETVTKYLLSDGNVVESKENLSEGVTVLRERVFEDKKVIRYLMSGASILEQTEILCKYIPIIPIVGDELIVDGKKNYISLIRFARDIQMMYNLLKSKETEIISLSAKSQWLAAKGQIPPNLMNDFKSANIKNIPVLFYETNPNNGPDTLPPPQQIQNRQIDSATILAAKECIDDIKMVTGVYDASLGAQGNETSGKAIIARSKQSQTSNAHFYESYTRALRHIGRILIDMIPNYYDGPRTIRIVGEDLTDNVIAINQMYPDEEGNLYNFEAVNNYAVVVDTGPTFETRRAETAQGIISILQANPQIWGTLGDILLQNLDWVGSDRAVRRIQATMNPAILAADQDGSGDINQMQNTKIQLLQLQQQMQAGDQQKQQMQQIIEALSAQLKSKESEYASRAQIAQIKADTELQRAGMGIQQEKIKQHTEYVKHAVDAATTMSTINPPQNSPAGVTNWNGQPSSTSV